MVEGQKEESSRTRANPRDTRRSLVESTPLVTAILRTHFSHWRLIPASLLDGMQQQNRFNKEKRKPSASPRRLLLRKLQQRLAQQLPHLPHLQPHQLLPADPEQLLPRFRCVQLPDDGEGRYGFPRREPGGQLRICAVDEPVERDGFESIRAARGVLVIGEEGEGGVCKGLAKEKDERWERRRTEESHRFNGCVVRVGADTDEAEELSSVPGRRTTDLAVLLDAPGANGFEDLGRRTRVASSREGLPETIVSFGLQSEKR